MKGRYKKRAGKGNRNGQEKRGARKRKEGRERGVQNKE